MTPLRTLPWIIAAAACAAPPPVPFGEGAGLLDADATPPEDAVLWDRPEWRVGDTFTLVRGELLRAEFTVAAVDDDGYFVRGPGGVRLRRDRDLGNLGEWHPTDDVPTHLLSPADVRFHWPLWVGKRWSCEYVDGAAGSPPLRTVASYEVEALDTVTVGAGTFEALRIARTLRLPDLPDSVLTRTQLIWYAPSIGAEVRQIVADTEVELVEFVRDAP